MAFSKNQSNNCQKQVKIKPMKTNRQNVFLLQLSCIHMAGTGRSAARVGKQDVEVSSPMVTLDGIYRKPFLAKRGVY